MREERVSEERLRGGAAERAARMAAVESGDAPVPLGRLWTGLLLAPGAWALGELAGYYLASRSCEPTLGGIPLAGTAYPATTHVVLQAAAAATAAVGVLMAWGSLRRVRRDGAAGEAPARGRAHFMALTGVLVSILFLYGIVLFGFSGFVVNACNQMR